METSKKRHNPPIFEEDSAVQAFDRNNDTTRTEERPVEEKSDLEKAIQTAMSSQEEVLTEKGDGALLEELTYLVTKIFGEDIYVMHMRNKKYMLLKDKYKEKISTMHWPLAKLKQKGSLFKRATYQETARITQLKKEAGDDSEDNRVPIFEEGRFNPIKIVAYTTEGLRKSKLFAKAYKAFTGQEVTVVRECVDEEEMKKAGLEGVVEKTSEVKVETQSALLSDVKIVSTENGSIEVKLAPLNWVDELTGYLQNIFTPSYELKPKFWSTKPAYRIIDIKTGREVARVTYDHQFSSNMPTRKRLQVHIYDSKVLPEVIKLSEDYKKLTGSEVRVHGNI